MLIDRFVYRPEIDGLRAVAVAAVVLFHAGFSCTGGYVGVDVFFVISGFLITSLIWKDLEAGSFTFARFWEKRARRIMPAIVVMMLVTLFAGLFILLPYDLRDLGQSAVAQSAFAGNVYFWIRGGYFEGPSVEKALLHTWSLAVEEQFYMLAPFILWMVFRSKILRTRKAIFILLTLGFLASLAISVHGVRSHPSAAYFLLPSRAWELMLGAMLAFCPAVPGSLNRRALREGLSVTGLGMILITVFLYSHDTPFPGLAALVPCLGTAMVIWANTRATTESTEQVPTFTGRFLATQPMVFAGLISYSLYLYHWPVFALARYEAMLPLSWGYRLLLILTGLILALLSWRFVETPFRKRTLGATRKRMFALAIAGGCAVFMTGMLMRVTQGLPGRYSPQVQEYAKGFLDRSFGHELSKEDIKVGRLIRIGDTTASDSPQLLVWGDSHAMSAMPAADLLLKELGKTGLAVTRSATPPVEGWPANSSKVTDQQIIAFNHEVLEWLKLHPVPNVLLVASWPGYIDSKVGSQADLSKALVETVVKLKAMGIEPWVMLSVPTQPFDVPRKLVLIGDTQTNTDFLNARPGDPLNNKDLSQQTLRDIEAAGGRVLNPKSAFLSNNNILYKEQPAHLPEISSDAPSALATDVYYIIQKDGRAIYSDSHHLSDSGARIVLLPFLRDNLLLEPAVTTTQPSPNPAHK